MAETRPPGGMFGGGCLHFCRPGHIHLRSCGGAVEVSRFKLQIHALSSEQEGTYRY